MLTSIDDVVEIRRECQKLHKDIESKAEKAGFIYVVVYWVTDLSLHVSHRIGYFDDYTEAEKLAKTFKDTYDNFGFPYYIMSNGVKNVDGGLFDEVR